jgi:hypothetical protein
MVQKSKKSLKKVTKIFGIVEKSSDLGGIKRGNVSLSNLKLKKIKVMANLSNEFGISKNRKIEILLEMGYSENSLIKGLYTNKSKELSLAGTSHWVNQNELDSCFFSDDTFKHYLTLKLNK